MSVRTRFAPSPTGNIHIGNIRVAIYNWLFARNQNGSFVLRIEDTDQQRSTKEAINTLLKTMDWLGITYDEEPLYQSEQVENHMSIAEDLLKKGLAYKEDKGNTGEGECIIFRMPKEDVFFHDFIKGDLKKPSDNLQDFVIVRSDGTPVFHLANVLDDIKQGITHIIRGDDHIENTYRHIALYKALKKDIPIFAHLPMIVNREGKPYSKRDGDAFVGDFKNKGYASKALFNYLALLGWSPGDDREIMTLEEMIRDFDLSRCQSSPAQIDIKKLTWMNGEYLSKIDKSEFYSKAEKLILHSYPNASINLISKIVPLIRDRVKFYGEVVPMTEFLFSDSYSFDEKTVNKKIKQEGIREILETLINLFEQLNVFDAQSIKDELHKYIEGSEKSFGTVLVPLRIAISGSQGGPDLFSLLSILGKKKVIDRIHKTINQFLD